MFEGSLQSVDMPAACQHMVDAHCCNAPTSRCRIPAYYAPLSQALHMFPLTMSKCTNQSRNPCCITPDKDCSGRPPECMSVLSACTLKLYALVNPKPYVMHGVVCWGCCAATSTTLVSCGRMHLPLELCWYLLSTGNGVHCRGVIIIMV